MVAANVLSVRRLRLRSQRIGSREWESRWTLDTVGTQYTRASECCCINHLDTVGTGDM